MTCKKQTTTTTTAQTNVDTSINQKWKAANNLGHIASTVNKGETGAVYNNVSSVKDTNLRQNNLKISDKALAIGKRKIVVDDIAVGPSADNRKASLDIVTLGSKDSDLFRFALGKYWTIENGNFLYLNGGNAAFTVKDFDFIKEGVEVAKDIFDNSERQKDIDTLVGSILTKDNVKNDSFLGTKQWILLQNIKGRFSDTTVKTSTDLPLATFNAKTNSTNAAVKGSKGVTGQSQLKNKVESLQYQEELWKAFVFGGKGSQMSKEITFFPLLREGFEFYDQSFEIQIPFSKKELSRFSGVNSPSYANVNMEYNFLVESYELQTKSTPETLIPNMYVIMSELNSKIEKKDFNDIITLNDSIKRSQIIPLVRTVGRLADIGAEYLMSDYFKDYASALNSLGKQSERDKRKNLNNLMGKFKNIGIPITNITILSDYESKKYMFPMYSEIEFSTDKTTVFSNILKDSKLSTTLMSQIMYDNDSSTNLNPGSYESKMFVEASELLQQTKGFTRTNNIFAARANFFEKPRGPIVSTNSVVTTKSYSYERKERKVWNITKWVNILDNPMTQTKEEQQVLSDISNLNFATFLDKETDEISLNNPAYNFYVQLLKMIFAGKLRKLAKDKFRSYEEMLNGKLAYSETVLYRIEKKLADQNGNPIGEPLQNFYLPNANEFEVYKFIDTQLRYGVNYAYTVYAYEAVIGTKYHYDNVQTSGEFALFSVTQFPYITLIETPYFSFSGTILDNPPISPEVEIVPYKGYNSELLFFFNGGIGDTWLDPVIIESADQEKINTLRKAKGYGSADKIRFRSDDHSGLFQIYRTDKWPRSYRDFEGRLLAAIETDVSKLSFQKASNAAFVDSIKPNKWYYYCFRTIDFHNNYSNPSELFRVKLVEDSGAVFPIIEECDFVHEIEKTKFKSMRKYLLIKPRISQTIVNEQKSGIENLESVRDVNNIQLGIMDESAFGKDYLIRLTSKQSGRMLEFKVRLNHNFVKRNI